MLGISRVTLTWAETGARPLPAAAGPGGLFKAFSGLPAGNSLARCLGCIGLLAGFAVRHRPDDNADNHANEKSAEDGRVCVHLVRSVMPRAGGFRCFSGEWLMDLLRLANAADSSASGSGMWASCCGRVAGGVWACRSGAAGPAHEEQQEGAKAK